MPAAHAATPGIDATSSAASTFRTVERVETIDVTTISVGS
jgi:hypothetical protein